MAISALPLHDYQHRIWSVSLLHILLPICILWQWTFK